jgi:predicted Zn-dependent protease
VQLKWEGDYLDGQSANRQRISIHLGTGGIKFTTTAGEVLYLPYGTLRQTQGFYGGEPVRLEWGEDLPQALVIRDVAFLSSLHQKSGRTGRHFHNPANRYLRLKLTLAAAVASVVIAASLYIWGIPAMSAVVTSYVPVSWEEKLGAGVMSHLASPESLCKDETLRQAVDQIFARLIPAQSDIPYTFQISIIDAPMVNAFAAPGGYIGLYHGLIKQTGSPEELAAVLAHEVQHIIKRHSTRSLLQQASSKILMAALSGDVTGAQAFGLANAGYFALLKNSRRAEREADEEGLKMLLEAGIDPGGMVAFFEGMKEREDTIPGIFKYFSSHPGTQGRIRHLKTLLAQARQGTANNLIGDGAWNTIKKSC